MLTLVLTLALILTHTSDSDVDTYYDRNPDSVLDPDPALDADPALTCLDLDFDTDRYPEPDSASELANVASCIDEVQSCSNETLHDFRLSGNDMRGIFLTFRNDLLC